MQGYTHIYNASSLTRKKSQKKHYTFMIFEGFEDNILPTLLQVDILLLNHLHH
jgi:hypothetical protein